MGSLEGVPQSDIRGLMEVFGLLPMLVCALVVLVSPAAVAFTVVVVDVRDVREPPVVGR